jgi:hypothetical protein
VIGLEESTALAQQHLDALSATLGDVVHVV